MIRKGMMNMILNGMPTTICDASFNSLEHYGIKGMKWGVRRTPEQLGHKRPKSEDYVASRQQRKKGVSGLSNKELRDLNERLRLEKEYRNLTSSEKEAGRKAANQVLKNSGLVVTAGIKIAEIYGLNAATVSSKFGVSEKTADAILKGAQAAGVITTLLANVTTSEGKKKGK